MNLGIDFGAINCKSSTGIVIPSKTKKVESLIGNEEYIEINNKKYVFGLGEYEVDKDVKFKQTHFLPLLFATICKSTTDINNNIMLGLPLHHYKQYKKDLKEFIQNNNDKEVTIKLKGKDPVKRRIIIDNIDVFPEGLAILYSLNQDELNKFNNRDMLIVDIGGSTTDVALLEGTGLDREIVKTHSVSYGMHNIYNEIKNYIQDNTEDKNISLEKCERILEKTFIHSVNGIDTNLDFIDDLLVDGTVQILKDIKLKFGKDFKSANMLVCGGGAKHLYSFLKIAQDNAIKVESITANAEGYKKVGDIKWNV